MRCYRMPRNEFTPVVRLCLVIRFAVQCRSGTFRGCHAIISSTSARPANMCSPTFQHKFNNYPPRRVQHAVAVAGKATPATHALQASACTRMRKTPQADFGSTSGSVMDASVTFAGTMNGTITKKVNAAGRTLNTVLLPALTHHPGAQLLLRWPRNC
jgi:hypothetical protein